MLLRPPGPGEDPDSSRDDERFKGSAEFLFYCVFDAKSKKDPL